jgi:hypothetical protein
MTSGYCRAPSGDSESTDKRPGIAVIDFEDAHQQFSQARFIHAVDGIEDRDPFSFAEASLGPDFANLADAHHEKQYVIGAANLFVNIAPNRFGFERSHQPGLLPGFDQCRFTWRVSGFYLSLGKNPSPPAAGGHHAQPPVLDGYHS